MFSHKWSLYYLMGRVKFLRVPNKPIALPSRWIGNTGNQYTWEDWDRDAKKNYPIRYFISEYLGNKLLRIEGRITRYLNDILSKYWYKDHMLSLKSKEFDYSYGWIDSDVRMLLACFNTLVNFVEKEKGLKFRTYDKKTRALVKYLYYYWKVERPRRRKAIDSMPYGYSHSAEAEERLVKRDTVMLIRLIKVRGQLWN